MNIVFSERDKGKKGDCSRSARMYILCTTGLQETQQTIIL